MFESKRRNQSFPDVTDVAPAELWERRKDVCIVDVRRPEEFEGELGRVPGSKLITLDQLPQRLDELPKNQTIVFVCRSGQRSAHAAAFAAQHGLTDVFNMDGGMLRWNELKLTLEKADVK